MDKHTKVTTPHKTGMGNPQQTKPATAKPQGQPQTLRPASIKK